MKYGLIVTIFFIFISQTVSGQIDWGIKGGLNFAEANDIKLYARDLKFKTDNNTGYHAGIFLKFKATKFYIRPELVYNVTKSSYDNSDFKIEKVDIPILFGFTLIKPISIFAGPSFQYILASDFDVLALEGFEKDLTAGFNIGLALEIGSFGIDARYERNFSNNVADFSNINATLNTKSEQFILSAFIKI